MTAEALEIKKKIDDRVSALTIDQLSLVLF